MKIKAVCEATELTDRAVRYYIEEGLIKPKYTENYMGRRTFDFTNEDLKIIKDIAVLRKYDFSIMEIRQMLTSPETIPQITKDLQNRIQANVNAEQMLLERLCCLKISDSENVSSLAAFLSVPVKDTPSPNEKRSLSKVLISYARVIAKIFVIWLPILLCINRGITSNIVYGYEYPVISIYAIIFSLLVIIPSVILIVFSKRLHKKATRLILLILCVLSIPNSYIIPSWITTHSETTDIICYRKFDAACLANRSLFFSEMFPEWPHYSDAKYYYQYVTDFDSTYDVYAEWPLEKQEFDKEVQRVKEVFENKNSEYYVTVKKGNWNCLVIHERSDPLFEEVTHSYDYFIFAYDEDALRVRYISCYSLQNGDRQPYYLSLEW